MMRLRPVLLAALSALGAALATGAGAGQGCDDRRIVRFGETTKSIAQRCGVTPGAIERRNPGLHIAGARHGQHINVPRPALPTPRVDIRGNPAISGSPGTVRIMLR